MLNVILFSYNLRLMLVVWKSKIDLIGKRETALRNFVVQSQITLCARFLKKMANQKVKTEKLIVKCLAN